LKRSELIGFGSKESHDGVSAEDVTVRLGLECWESEVGMCVLELFIFMGVGDDLMFKDVACETGSEVDFGYDVIIRRREYLHPFFYITLILIN